MRAQRSMGYIVGTTSACRKRRQAQASDRHGVQTIELLWA